MISRTLAVRPDLDFGGMWQAVIYGLEEGVILFDQQGNLLAGNPAAERMLGLSLNQMRQQSLRDPRWHVVSEDGLPLEYERYPAFRSLQSGQSETDIMGVRSPSGLFRWLQVKAQPLKQGAEVTHVVASFSDVTEQRETQRHLEREALFRATLLQVVTDSLSQGLDESIYQRLLEGAAQAIPGVQAGSLLLLEEGRYRFVAAVNYDLEALRQVYLLPEEMYRGEEAHNLLLVAGFDNSRVDEDRRDIIDTIGRADEIEVCMSIPVLLNGEPIAYFSLDNFETPDAFSTEALEMGRIFAQLTAALWQRFKLEADTNRLAFYDALTGLPNRSLLYDRLRQAVAQRQDRPLAVMFMDLDNFKHVNDTFGHDTGDALLQAVAARLNGVLRKGDTLARWGGDEFVLLTQLERPEDTAVVAEKLLQTLEDPFRVGGQEVRTRGSIGVELLRDPHQSIEELVTHADIALYRAKALGKNTYQFFTRDMKRHLRARLELEGDLREALRRSALTLSYQPRFDLETQAITSVEALVRWQHSGRGQVSPSEFIPVAEETGMILLLGQQVLDMAAHQAKAWQASGTPRRVAVNVSAAQLASPDFVKTVQDTLARYRLDPRLLELEITERAAMTHIEDTVVTLGQLRELGVRTALDDFGTAYSSLVYLKRLPLDVLKIDQAFVRDLVDTSSAEGQDAQIVRAIIELGRSFGLTVVAEGVETKEQLELLRAFGCHEVQGYYLARPQPATALEAYSTKPLLDLQDAQTKEPSEVKR